MTFPAHVQDLNQSLAVELFHRASISAGVGMIGIVIMAYPHIGVTPWQAILTWALMMFMVFAGRLLFSYIATAALASGQKSDRFLNLEVFLCAMTGFGWGRTLYVFDSSAMDQPFYLRLMILAAALAFVVSSMAVFVRLFLAYTLPIVFSVIAFIVSHGYVEPKSTLLTCVALYFVMIIAVAVGYNRRLRAATNDHIKVLLLTQDLNAALENERGLREALSTLARTDELTGVSNRRAILDSLRTEMAKCERLGSSLAILLIDIDHFKRINDTYGHAAGDLALKTVVQTVQDGLRDTDVFGRVGGEEFLVLLPPVEPEGAILLSERLRNSVETTGVSLPGHFTRITISIGVAYYRNGDDVIQLMSRADKALYAAKENGRNRVEIEVPESSASSVAI